MNVSAQLSDPTTATREAVAVVSEKGAKSPWYQLHTGTLMVYPHGCELLPTGHVLPKKGAHLNGVLRGDIDGFSTKAATRLRRFCVRMEVPGRSPLAVTLTTHGLMTAKEWRRAWKRFRMRAVRAGVPFVYRVELQKRKTPHVHLVAWVANQEQRRLFTEGWLECVEEQDDVESCRHAVDTREIGNQGWLVYLALHHGKHKQEQLGWEGKQWGVVCEGLFRDREAMEFPVTDEERFKIQRVVRRLLAVPRGPTPAQAAAMRACPGLVWHPAKRVPRVLPSRGAWLRCVSAELMERVVAWARM